MAISTIGQNGLNAPLSLTSPTITGGTITGLTGNLTFASGTNGIVFNNSGATSTSTLNDYETGTWTPVLKQNNNATVASSMTGRYIKIGAFVWCQMYGNRTDTTVTTGTITWSSPFAMGINNGFGIAGQCWIDDNFCGEVCIDNYAGSISNGILPRAGTNQYMTWGNYPTGAIPSFTATWVYKASF